MNWNLVISTAHSEIGVNKLGRRYLKQVALVHQLPLALLQLCPQPPQLTLILPQQRALIHILIHSRSIADVLGSIGKLEGAQRLCTT